VGPTRHWLCLYLPQIPARASLPSARFSPSLLSSAICAPLSLSLPTHRSTEPASASTTTARVGLRRHQEFEATVVLLLPSCRAHGDGRAPLFLRRSETEAGAVAASPPPGLAGDGGAAGRASSAWRRQRGEGEPTAGVLCFSIGRASYAEEGLRKEEEGARSCLQYCAHRETMARGFAYGPPHVSTSSRAAVNLECRQDPPPGAGGGGRVLASLTSSVVIPSG
jgi:hypothetical protein